MNLPRVRLRTILITIAALAIMMGAFKFLSHRFGVSVASIKFERSSVVIALGLQPGMWDVKIPGQGPDSVIFYDNVWLSIPLNAVVAVIALGIGLAVLARAIRVKLRRTRTP